MGACLIDRKLQVVAPGQEGELCLFGAGLARGYRGLPALTGQNFPLVHIPGQGAIRIYRTGDRAKSGPDGTFVYRGRMDSQLKFKGYRIEPGEVEAALSSLPEVADASVALLSSPHHSDRLVAHVVMKPDAPSPDPDHLRDAGIDSLAMENLLFAIEDEFGITLGAGEIAAIAPSGNKPGRASPELQCMPALSMTCRR